MDPNQILQKMPQSPQSPMVEPPRGNGGMFMEKDKKHLAKYLIIIAVIVVVASAGIWFFIKNKKPNQDGSINNKSLTVEERMAILERLSSSTSTVSKAQAEAVLESLAEKEPMTLSEEQKLRVLQSLQ